MPGHPFFIKLPSVSNNQLGSDRLLRLNFIKEVRVKTMRDDGLLPEPHRFRISQVELVDLSTAEMRVESNVDPTSPMWTRNGFVTMQAPSSDATNKL